jgi:ATP-dependent helicase/nuclease subunit B
MVRSGVSSQLTLTAAILAGGGFADAGELAPGELLYVRVNGARSAALPRGAGEAGALAEAALESLVRRIDHFDDPATPYRSWALPQHMGDWGGDYDHLARVWEWRVVGEGDA